MSKFVNLSLTLFFLILCFSLSSCYKTKKENEATVNSLKTNKFYMLNHNLNYPAEIKVNGLVAEIDLDDSPFTPVSLNDYILKSGVQNVEITLYALKSLEKFNFKSINKSLEISSYNWNNEQVENFNNVKKLNFPEIDKEIPVITKKWNFEASVPYSLVGWSKSEDLKKWNENELKEAVLNKFNQLRQILNSGNGELFVSHLKIANEEMFKANYWSEEKQKEYIVNLAKDYSKLKGLLPEISECQLKILADGKAVTLEKIGKNHGQGVLTTEDVDNNIQYLNYITLHKPSKTKGFEVIRYSSDLTAIYE